MSNASIRTAFARFWEHVIAKTGDAVAQAKSYTDSKVSSLVSADSVNSSISTHNTSVTAHSDIRELITALTTRLNTLADSDDVTLDQLSEIVAYIKSNKTLIESVTTDKLNVSDVIDNLTTAVSSKALSANQGVAIKNLIDTLQADLDSHTHAEQVSFHGITTGGTGEAYTATVDGIDTLTAGASFIMVPHVESTSTSPTLDVNGLGVIRIRRRLSTNTTTTSGGASDNWLTANKPIAVTYDGTFWIADLPKTSATDLMGIVPIQNGGTGVSTEADLKTLINGMVYQIGGDEPASGPILWFDATSSTVLPVSEDVKF